MERDPLSCRITFRGKRAGGQLPAAQRNMAAILALYPNQLAAFFRNEAIGAFSS